MLLQILGFLAVFSGERSAGKIFPAFGVNHWGGLLFSLSKELLVGQPGFTNSAWKAKQKTLNTWDYCRELCSFSLQEISSPQMKINLQLTYPTVAPHFFLLTFGQKRLHSLLFHQACGQNYDGVSLGWKFSKPTSKFFPTKSFPWRALGGQTPPRPPARRKKSPVRGFVVILLTRR